MRIDVKKFLFIGPKSSKELFFSEAQKKGFIQFITPKEKKNVTLPLELENYTKAIKILRGFVIAEQDKRKNLPLAKQVAIDVIEMKKHIDEANDKLRKITQEIQYIAPFGDFSVAALEDAQKEMPRSFRFYVAKTIKHMQGINEDLILVNSQDGLDYFVAIASASITHPDLIEVQIPTSIADLKKEKHSLEKFIARKESELKVLTRYNWLLHYALIEGLNSSHFHIATNSANELLDDTLFVVEGWVPENKNEPLLQMATELNIIADEVAISPEDPLPTYLENKGVNKIGEDVIHIFDEPSPSDKDPSIWVLSAFSLFFAMIVGDAGYGMIFLLAAIAMKLKIKNLKGQAKRLVGLLTILAISCIVWGGLMNSFFSIPFPQESAFRKYSLINWMLEKKADFHLKSHDDVYEYWLKKYPAIQEAKTGQEFLLAAYNQQDGSNPIIDKFSSNITLEIALFVGSIHIIIGMLRYIKRLPTNLGWLLFIIGCYLYFPYYLDATSMIHFIFGVPKASGAQFGLQLIYGGVGIATLIALIKNGLSGILECMAAIQIFADVMSYLRIYALGFAGAIVSTQINEMAANLPLALAICAVIMSHALNIILSIMGGVIHGLRLNFLEWYRYSFEGGGKQFKPLELHVFE